MAYSLDLRQKVIDACDRGMKTKPVAELFGRFTFVGPFA